MAKIYKTNLATDMDVSDYLLILIFQKASSTGPLKNTAPGAYTAYIFDWVGQTPPQLFVLKFEKITYSKALSTRTLGLASSHRMAAS